MPSKKKPSFLLYVNDNVLVEELSDEDAGKLFKAIFAFADHGEDRSDELDPLPRMVYKRMARYIAENTLAYYEKCEKIRQMAMEREQRKRESL